MGLKDLKLPEATITLPGGDVTVRGLSLTDIIVLTAGYAPAMRKLYLKFTAVQEADAEKADDDPTKGQVDWVSISKEALATAPSLVAEVIALCAGEPDAVDVAQRLPAPVAIQCLEAIGLHTIEAGGGLKKVVETVIRVANATTNAVTDLQKP